LHRCVSGTSGPPGEQHMSCCRQHSSMHEGLPLDDRMTSMYSGPQCGSSVFHSDSGAPLHQLLPQKLPHNWPSLRRRDKGGWVQLGVSRTQCGSGRLRVVRR
jgi:hypothetical protein